MWHPDALANALSSYLTPEHRDEVSGGCATGSLPVDVSRQPREAQSVFADGLESYINLISRYCAGSSSVDRQSAIATLSALVGAIILSRAVRCGRSELSDEILQTVETVQKAATRGRPQPETVKHRAKFGRLCR